MNEMTEEEFLQRAEKRIKALEESMKSTTLALRQARARVLGVTMAELEEIDNRTYLISSVMEQHGLSEADAVAYVDDMEQQARDEREEAEKVLAEEREQFARSYEARGEGRY